MKGGMAQPMEFFQSLFASSTLFEIGLLSVGFSSKKYCPDTFATSGDVAR